MVRTFFFRPSAFIWSTRSRPLGGFPMSLRIFFVISEAGGCLQRRVSCHYHNTPRTSPKTLLSGQAERLRRSSLLRYCAHASRHGRTTCAALCPISSCAPTSSAFQLPFPRAQYQRPSFLGPLRRPYQCVGYCNTAKHAIRIRLFTLVATSR